MKAMTTAIALSALMLAGPSLADEAMAKKNGCATCHDVSAKKIGPTWKDIAAKADAAAIKGAIEHGSKGKYGKIPMPPQPKAMADADALAKWIVSLK